VYISTLSGLNSLAQEAVNSGKIDSAASERFLSERYLAETHGVISPTQFPIEKIEEAMLSRIGQSQQQSLSSDISVDLDTDLGTVKKTSIKKDKSGYYPIKNPLLLNEGMRVFYSPSGKKDQKDIRQGTVLEKRLVEGVGSSPTPKQGKKPSRKTGLAFRGKTYMFLIQSDSKRREHWIYSNQIWTEKPLVEDDEQVLFFDQEESTNVDEYVDSDD
jgi:ribosomal protein L44E